MNISKKYLEALKAIDDWVTIPIWADRVVEIYPALLEQANEDARNQVRETTGLAEIAARISSAVSTGTYAGEIDVDYSESPKKVKYAAEELRIDKAQFDKAYQLLRKLFVDGFSGFDGFSTNEEYIATERRYKDDLLEIYQRDALPLLESENWAAVGPVLAGLFNVKLPSENGPQNLVGWRYSDPITKLPEGELPNFAMKVAKLLDEALPLDQRIDQFLSFFRQLPAENQLKPAAASRSVVSFFLTLNNPKKYFFVKTREMGNVCKRFDPEFKWASEHIQADEIEYLNRLGRRLFERLRAEGWEPRDLIDVQSFLWSAESHSANYAEGGAGSKEGLAAEGKTHMENFKNRILYGPPGTGKTYHTVNKALEVLDPEYLISNLADRPALKQRFDELKAMGRIGFVTFHQSFSYEDFVEGLRASTDKNGQIRYEVGDGIFKRMCDAAAGRTDNSSPTRQAAARPFQKGETIHGNYVVEKISPELLQVRKPNGSIVPFSWEMLDELADLIKSGQENIEDIGTSTVFDNVDTKLEQYIVNGYDNIIPAIINRLIEGNPEVAPVVNLSSDSWVLIIDEINRGNIANILGELITLIEPSKRAGAAEALEVTLPYSKTKFSVPPNLYIIGTMNTADRSLIHIDTALRRRFHFEAMLPDIGVLNELGIHEVEGIDIQKMLRTLNSRIELLYDKEHTLGHSFFVPLRSAPDLPTLSRIFENQIMPLLEEYFFEDWSRIQQILGDDLKEESSLKFYVPAFEQKEIEVLLGSENHQAMHEKAFMRNEHALLSVEAFRGIYEQPVNSG